MFSPHPWGWTVIARLVRRHCAVFPTPVGMDRNATRTNHRIIVFPHTRGDGPPQVYLIEQHYAFSPHPWGWTETREC